MPGDEVHVKEGVRATMVHHLESALKLTTLDGKRIDELESKNKQLEETVVQKEHEYQHLLLTKEKECQRLLAEIKMLKGEEVAVAKVMVDDNTYDGILITILEYVIAPSSSLPGQIRNDGGIETIIPPKTQDDIIMLTLVSKRFHRIISTQLENGTKKWNIIPVVEFKPRQHQQGSELRILKKLIDSPLNDETNSKAQYYSHLELKDIHTIFRNEEEEEFSVDGLSDDIQLTGIISLRVLPPSRPLEDSITNGIYRDRFYCPFIIDLLVFMIPHLREIDFSNNNFEGDNSRFWSDWLNPGLGFTHRDSIESVRWDNNRGVSKASLTGGLLEFCDNLTQIIMDDSIFEMEERDGDVDDDGDEIYLSYRMLEEEEAFNNIFIFHHCCGHLQRVSIRNARYIFNGLVKCVTQKALIKIVRKAPSLKWFRSDLSQENVDMLRKEKPDIEFVINANRLRFVNPAYLNPDGTGLDESEYTSTVPDDTGTSDPTDDPNYTGTYDPYVASINSECLICPGECGCAVEV